MELFQVKGEIGLWEALRLIKLIQNAKEYNEAVEWQGNEILLKCFGSKVVTAIAQPSQSVVRLYDVSVN